MSSSVLRGGLKTSTSRQVVSCVRAPCETQGGTTATSPARIVRDSPSIQNSNSPSSTMTIYSSTCTWVGASVFGSNETKLTIVSSPSTGWKPRPGSISTTGTADTSTNRPGAVGVPPATVLKCCWSLVISRLSQIQEGCRVVGLLR